VKKVLSVMLTAMLALAGISTQAVAAHAATAAPDAPAQVSGLGGDSYIAARVFTASTGEAATTVTVTASPGGASCTIVVPAITCDITGLTNGTNYSLSAVSNNSAGSSAATSSGWSVAPTASPAFTSVENDCPGATWVLQPCYAAHVPTTITLHGSNLQACTQVSGFGGRYWTAIPTVVNPAGTTLSFVHPADGSAFGWMAMNCGITQNSFMVNALYPVGAFYSVTPSWSSNYGPLSGGATVTLTTSYYAFAGVTDVTLGGKAVSYTVLDATHMQIVIPAGDAPGAVDLAVTNSDGLGTLTGAYTYIPDPVAAPGTPGKPTVVAGVEQATVTVSAPTTGGAPESYTVTSSPDGQTCVIYSPDTSCTISGLTAGVDYTFTVTAANAGGTSGSSPASDPSAPLAPPTYSLTYDANGGDASSVPADNNAYSSGARVWVDNNTEPQRLGYIFAGWNTATDGSGSQYYGNDSFFISSNTTLYAVWNKGLTVSYDGNGATSGSVPVDPTGYRFLAWIAAMSGDGLHRSGYTFAGWNTAPDGSGEQMWPGDINRIFDDMTLYAQWKKALGVSYQANGATGGSVPTDSNAYDDGSGVVVADGGTLHRDGYRFIGWNTAPDGSGDDYSVEQAFNITGDVTLYAQWIRVYTVSYDSNGASAGSVPQDSNTYAKGYTATVLASQDLARAGYEFLGWNTQADGSGTNYGASDTFSLEADVTLFAQWKKISTPSLGKTSRVHRFKAFSAMLRPGMRTQVNKFLRAVEHGATVVCEGHTGGRAVTKALRSLAKLEPLLFAHTSSTCDPMFRLSW